MTLTLPFTKTLFATVADCGTCRNDYVANGVTTTFAYSFKVQSKNDLIVYIDSTAKTVDTDYTVNNVGNGSGGSVIFKIAPTNLSRVAIVRNPTLAQASSYPQGGGFSGVRVESDFDKLAIGLQALREAYNRSLRFAPYSNKNSSNLGLYLPDPVAQKCIGWNSTATAIVNNDCSGGGGGGSGNAVTLQGRNISSGTPNNGQVLTWNASSGQWEPAGAQTIANAVYNNQANVYTAGVTQTVTASATSAGFNVAPVAGDPSNPQDGDIWYNSSLGKFRKREAGSTTNLDTTGGTPAFSDITAATNTNALVIGTGGSLATSGSGTIAATTAAALASTPTLCTTGQAATGIVANGNATGCASFFAQRTLTATDAGIAITNGNGVSGNPTIGLGSLAVKTNASNTITAGDQNLAGASSLTIPVAAGATPTVSGRIAYDSTANRYKFGANGSTITIPTLAEIQPLHANLTALSGLTGAANSLPQFSGAGTMVLAALPSCADSAGQHLNFVSGTWSCGTSSTGGLSGLTTNKYLLATGATSAGTAGALSESGGIVSTAGGLTVGAGNYLIVDTSGISGSDKTWTVLNFSGTIRPSTGALTPGNVVTTDANGLLVDGGAAGAGDVTLKGIQELENKTINETTNTIKITKSVQVELFGPTTDTASGDGAYYFRVPVSLNGTNLVGIQTNTVTAGTTGLTSVQITRCAAVATSPLCSGATASMLSTVVSIDSGETSSSTAATPAGINAANDDVATGQILRFDVTAINTTPAKGLIVNLDFKLP